MTWTAWLALYKQELKKLLSYRFDFWFQFFSSVGVEILIAFILWSALFKATQEPTLGGFTYSEMVKYYILASFFSRWVRGAENFSVSSEIYEGSLTRYLIYPGHYLIYKIANHMGFMTISLLQSLIGFGVCFVIYVYLSEEFIEITNLFLAFILVFLAAGFNFILMSGIELVAFWADNVWSLSIMARFITSFLSGMLIPLTLYPEWLQNILNWTPFPSIVYIPVQVALGHVIIYDFYKHAIIIIFWSILFLILWLAVWRMGLRQYTGVGQ